MVYKNIDEKTKRLLKFFGFNGSKIKINEKDLKRAYRLLSKEHHPDLNGDEEYFKNIKDRFEELHIIFLRDRLYGKTLDLSSSSKDLVHGEFAFSYRINGVSYRL